MSSSIRHAVILVGGKGERLGKLTRSTPKPLLPIAGRPFLEYLLDSLAFAGVRDILLSCGYLAEKFVSRYDGKIWQGARMSCVVEKYPAGTGGALAHMRSMLASRFFLLNGDSYVKPDWSALAHELGGDSRKRMGVLCLTRHPGRANRYGVVQQSRDGRIIAFKEKNTEPDAGGMINGGVYALFSQAIDEITPTCSLEKDVFPKLAGKGLLTGLVCGDCFIDIGTPEDYERAQLELPVMLGGNSDSADQAI